MAFSSAARCCDVQSHPMRTIVPWDPDRTLARRLAAPGTDSIHSMRRVLISVALVVSCGGKVYADHWPADGEGGGGAGDGACVPGLQISCQCPAGGAAVQTCLDNGRGFGECIGCDDVDTDADAAGSGGAGGCEPERNPCSVPQNCGPIDVGCGQIAQCSTCESTSPYLSCNQDTHQCDCTWAPGAEAQEKCDTFPGTYPYFCGNTVPRYRGPIGCLSEDLKPISNGEIVVCCYE